jgi:NAD(P)-dependent dehydrogenase (short-subunit alcohol dehydrogenase family)
MHDFSGKIAVITGAGSGMGRELAKLLASDGCHLALCDVSAQPAAETAALCLATGSGVKVTTHTCDVTDETAVIAVRDEIRAGHGTEHINLLFNNAGISGSGSFVTDARADWERTFNTSWFGVYYCTRAFLPLLIAADEANLVNTSSINGFWASQGPRIPHTAYCAAKFAVKGFSEALISDLRLNAPHVKVTVVMPGHIGTDIATNSAQAHGAPQPMELDAEAVARVRNRMVERGHPVGNQPDDFIRALLKEQGEKLKSEAPTTAAEAAAIILDAVRNDRWRVLVGEDAYALDAAVRAAPESAYDDEFLMSLTKAGHFSAIVSRIDR